MRIFRYTPSAATKNEIFPDLERTLITKNATIESFNKLANRAYHKADPYSTTFGGSSLRWHGKKEFSMRLRGSTMIFKLLPALSK